MKACRLLFLPFLMMLDCQLGAAEPTAGAVARAPLDWARLMADSEMARRGDTLFRDGEPRANWNYQSSLFGLALLKLSGPTGDPSYREFGARTAESFVAPDGTIATYRTGSFDIDMIAPGKILLWRLEHDQAPAGTRAALVTLRQQLREQPRTSDGGFWHKRKFPNQMWLDGLFMAAPFLAHYGSLLDESPAFDDVALQFVLMDRHSYDPSRGLHLHAWDETRSQTWADPATGRSRIFWSRAIGWYAMALVDSMEHFPADHPQNRRLHEIFVRVADGIVRWQDASSGLWWQVTDQGGRERNYLESSASAMFVYALAKGINQKLLSREAFLPATSKGFAGIVRELVRTEPDGRISLTQCCEVAALGRTNAAGLARDGTYGYYVSEPIVANDLKGLGPFILAGIEMEMLVPGKTFPSGNQP